MDIARRSAPARPHLVRIAACLVVALVAVLASNGRAQAPTAPAATGPAAATARDDLMQAQLIALPAALVALMGIDLAQQTFQTPLPGHTRVSSGFGWRNISVNGNRFHGGIDFPAAVGTPVRAARDGVVVRAGWWGTYGYAVAIDHGDGSETRYAHLSSYAVSAGENLRQGDVLGGVGSTGASTGPHLHFELRFDERAVDPTSYLEQSTLQVRR